MSDNKSKIIINGIKCDRCDYKDDTVKYKDYRKFINKKCPKCGMNLLTVKEYMMCKFMVGIVKLYNKLFKNQKDITTVEINIVDKERFNKNK